MSDSTICTIIGRVKGFSLIQVLAGLTVLGLMGAGVSKFLQMQSGLSSQFKHKELALGILQRETAHAKVQPLSGLPSEGQCQVRTYDLFGNLRSVSEVMEATQSACMNKVPQEVGIKTVLTVERVVASDAQFEPAQFLKLPRNGSNLKRIRISAATRAGTKKSESRPVEVIIFVRDKG